MSYVPGFKYDIFISYAREDDGYAQEQNAEGWVQRFKRQLAGELAQLLGGQFSEDFVFLDKHRLRVGQSFPVELDDGARRSAVLLAIVSPSYADSEWCSRERRVFRERFRDAEFAECLVVVNVRNTDLLPPTLANAQHFDFIRPGSEEPYLSNTREWLEGVNKLASQIKIVLRNLRSRASTVFLGSSLHTDMDLRERLASYLSNENFRTAPDFSASLDDLKQCREAITNAACAVHFIGGASDISWDVIEVSVNHCKNTVLFKPFGVNLTAFETEFLSELQTSAIYSPQIVLNNESELKQVLKDLLSQRKVASWASKASLALICDVSDFEWAQKVEYDGITAEYPRFLAEQISGTQKLRYWKQLVRDCHGLLFYYGLSDEKLLSSIWKVAEERGNSATRRWFLAEPNIVDKQNRYPQYPIYPDGLFPFLDEVRRRAAGSQP
jgi:hypothetical protein